MRLLKLCPFLLSLFNFFQSYLCSTENNAQIPENFILTPLIRRGDFAKAKALSQVEPFPGHNFTSYAGYLTIDEMWESNMYFWYFPAKMNSGNAPVVIYISGGPGITSMYALFGEVGPFYVLPNMTLDKREYDWSKEFNILIIEFPAGTGFSSTKSVKGYAKTHEDIGRQGYQFLQQFFILFSEHRTNDLYIAGESYGGAYPFYIAQVISEENSNPNIKLKINLKGVISVSWPCDSPTMYFSSEYLYSVGLLTEKDKNFFASIEERAKALCDEGLYRQCYRTLAPLTLYFTTSFIHNITGYDYLSNINRINAPKEFISYYKFLTIPKLQKQIHAGGVSSIPEGSYIPVRDQLEGNLMRDHKEIVKTVLNKNYKVLIMTGQLDAYVPPLYQRRFISNLDWNGKEDYNTAERIIWRVDPRDDEISGYVTTARNLVEIMVRNSGHMIPFDNPRASWDALKRFIYNKPFG